MTGDVAQKIPLGFLKTATDRGETVMRDKAVFRPPQPLLGIDLRHAVEVGEPQREGVARVVSGTADRFGVPLKRQVRKRFGFAVCQGVPAQTGEQDFVTAVHQLRADDINPRAQEVPEQERDAGMPGASAQAGVQIALERVCRVRRIVEFVRVVIEVPRSVPVFGRHPVGNVRVVQLFCAQGTEEFAVIAEHSVPPVVVGAVPLVSLEAEEIRTLKQCARGIGIQPLQLALVKQERIRDPCLGEEPGQRPPDRRT